jgi:hypothetical protein
VIGAEAVAFLRSVEVKTMLPGVAATVRELLTAKVMVTAAALLVIWAFDSGMDKRLSASATMTQLTFLEVFKLKLLLHSYLATGRKSSRYCV